MIEQLLNSAESQGFHFLAIITLTGIFGLLSSIYLVLLLVKKIQRRRIAFIRKKHWKQIQDALASILIQSLSDNDLDPSCNSSMNLLKRSVKKSVLIKQWLLEEIINQKSNLSGDSSKILLKIYNDLGLKSLSIKKIKSRRWDLRAKGMLELEKMQQNDCFTLFYDFLGSRNKEIRKTARLGLTSLSPNPIDFLNYQTEELTEWEQMNIAHRLAQRPKDKLPDFSKYFTHAQSSVVAFCIRMSVKFGSYDHIPMIIEQLNHHSSLVQKDAVDSLSEIGAYQAHEQVYALAFSTKKEGVIIACLEYLANLGSKKHRYLIERMLTHKSTSVRMAAVKTAITLDLEFPEMNTELHRMYLHHQHELI